MKNGHLLSLLIVALLMIPGVVRAEEAGPTAYMEMSSHYEAIRLALLADSLDGLSENAQAIQQQAAGLLEEFSAVAAGVPEENAGDFETVLQEIEVAAAKLVDASSLDAAREDFFALTKPMAKYRKLTGDDHTVVAYCPMAQKAWIQPEGEIGNPYLGQAMPTCGEVVGE